MKENVTLALFFGNRGFFPERLIAAARQDLTAALRKLGIDTLLPEENLTRFGAVETIDEGRQYAAFLDRHRGRYQGVVLCLPNFGDENGAAEALRDCGVPIFILAYPDRLDEMDFASRRDAFCGKFSVMDVFLQYGIPFTIFPPHTVHPSTELFARQMRDFAAVCRIVAGMKRCTIGAVGARTSVFKTIRYDELALQKYGITTEVFDLAEVVRRVNQLDVRAAACRAKADRLKNYTDFSGVPAANFDNLVKLGVVLDELIAEKHLDALALRCWIELEQTLRVAPCVLLSELNDRGIPAACELDVCNAVVMRALHLAAAAPPACLDWNNNYGDDPDRCILFHCGPVAQSLMTARGKVIDHPMFAKSFGAGSGYGCNVGRIAPTPFTFASLITKDGHLSCYLGEGEFTADPIPPEFFGCGGVAHIPQLQQKLYRLGYAGYRHHVSVAPGRFAAALQEAFVRYLHYSITEI